jgi:glutamate dehydrogenase (NAD(P)+)
MTQFEIKDELGPDKVVYIHEAKVGLEAFVVIDNVACGPAIGGVRMASDVSAAEVSRLARAMTFKNAAAGLAHGGGKAGIVHDPNCPDERKEELVRAFARAIRSLDDYIPGPDMGTNETSMAQVYDEIRRAVGLPRVLGGIPLDDIGATGYGVAIAAEVAAPHSGLELRGARVAVQGFGSVGQHAARFLAERGAVLVAASDSRGAIHHPEGLDVSALIAHKATNPVAYFPKGRAISREELIEVDCDIWIPAARPDVLTESNVAGLKARLVLQGANVPATEGAERLMHERGVVSVPDFIANAGGVICAAVEYHGGTQSIAMQTIAEKVRANTDEVLSGSKRREIMPREAAVALAKVRVAEAMTYRRR